MITQTQTGTLLVNGIEYNEYPPPQQLIKAMERRWAEELVQNGRIRLHELEYFRQWENNFLGDPNDGHGLYHLEEHPMQTGAVNDVYAWCLSLPEIRNERLLAIAEKGKYDYTICVRSTEELLMRIQASLQQSHKGFWLHKIQLIKNAPANKHLTSPQQAFPVLAALGFMAEGVIDKHQCRHGFHHRYRAGTHTWVMAPPSF